METWISKTIIIFIMLFVSLLFGLVPIKVVSRLKLRGHRSNALTQRVISLLNCFAGGVFLATTFLHLLPEVKEGMEALLEKKGVKTPFPVTEFMVTGGMFVIMFIEHLVMAIQHHHGDVSFPSSSENSYEEKQPLCHSHKEDDSQGSSGFVKSPLKSYGSMKDSNRSFVFQNKALSAIEDSHEGRQREEGAYGSIDVISEDNKNQDTTLDNKGQELCEDRDKQVHRCSEGEEQIGRRQPRDIICASHNDVILSEGACVHVIKPTHHQHHHIAPQQLGGIRSFLLLLAMSLHTVFEGLAIGLQPNNTAVWSLFLAVIIHKVVIAFSLGIQFAENLQYVGRAVLFIVFFAIMSPLGTAIGTAMTETIVGNSGSIDTASAVLQGLSTGVFLYVTFFEVLGKEVGSDHSLVKVCLIILGYGVIAGVQLLLPEPEE